MLKLKVTPLKNRSGRLDSLMVDYQLTSNAVGELLEVHPVTVRKWRCGMIPMPAASLIALEALCAGLS